MSSSSMPPPADRPWKPLAAPHCPRCGSPNTKFCYFNNYSLSQPRYFCKTCRRYWTMGGSLRNVPVGGGCRKNRRPTPKSMTRPGSPTAPPPIPAPAPTPAAFDSSHVHLQVHDAAAVASPGIDLAALYARFSNQCAPPPPPPPSPPPPQQFGPGFAVVESDSSSGGYLFGERPNGEDFLGQVMSQQLQHRYSINSELEFPAEPSGAGGVFGNVSLGAPSPLEFIDSFASSDLDLSVPDLVNEDSIYKLALESAPAEGMVFHHHDTYRY